VNTAAKVSSSIVKGRLATNKVVLELTFSAEEGWGLGSLGSLFFFGGLGSALAGAAGA